MDLVEQVAHGGLQLFPDGVLAIAGWGRRRLHLERAERLEKRGVLNHAHEVRVALLGEPLVCGLFGPKQLLGPIARRAPAIGKIRNWNDARADGTQDRAPALRLE